MTETVPRSSSEAGGDRLSDVALELGADKKCGSGDTCVSGADSGVPYRVDVDVGGSEEVRAVSYSEGDGSGVVDMGSGVVDIGSGVVDIGTSLAIIACPFRLSPWAALGVVDEVDSRLDVRSVSRASAAP